MSKWDELKRLAESIKEGCGLQGAESEEAMFNFECAATPEVILALIAENERLSEMANRLADEGISIADERDQLRDEVESLGKDAERYRWLRGHHGLSLKGHDFISYGEVADFRIDNAMTVVKADG